MVRRLYFFFKLLDLVHKSCLLLEMLYLFICFVLCYLLLFKREKSTQYDKSVKFVFWTCVRVSIQSYHMSLWFFVQQRGHETDFEQSMNVDVLK
jgi:hypothetical protein